MHKETSVYNQYVREVKKYSLLTENQEKELSHGIKKGNAKALECLINSNLRLVIKIARHYIVPSNKLMDIIQEGNIGLMTAAKKFSPDFNVRFASYAAIWIKQSISRYLASNDDMIRLPSRKATLVQNIKKFRAEFRKTNKREPVSEEILKGVDIEKNQFQMLHAFVYGNFCSLDASLGSGKREKNNSTLYDYVTSDSSGNPETIYITQDIELQLDRQLDFLGARDKDIIKNRYSLNSEKKVVPFYELGKKYSISPEAVRQIAIRAIKKLRSRKEVLLNAIPF